MLRLFVLALSLLGVFALGIAQGGQGGGGFGGGSAQGPTAGQGEQINRSLFLSPGDRTEWSFEAKEHDAVLVKVTSSVFDPAVAILDAKGATLASNDDLEPGNQMAQLVFAVPKAGTYKVVVTNYKGTAGGQFELSVRRFRALDLHLATATKLELENAACAGLIDIKDLGDYIVTEREAPQYGPPPTLLDPTGEPFMAEDFGARQPGYRRFRFTADEKGRYYVFPGGGFRSSIAIDKVTKVATELVAKKGALRLDEVQDWTIAAKKNQVLEIALVGDPENMVVVDRQQFRSADGKVVYAVIAAPGPLKRYVMNVLGDGPITVSVFDVKGAPAEFTLRTAEVSKPLPPSTTSPLDWHEWQFWTVNVKPGDVLTLDVVSDTYLPELQGYGPDGSSWQSFAIGKTPARRLAIPARAAGQYVVAVHGGGKGEYRLSQKLTEPKRLAPGAVSSHLSPNQPEVWRFTAAKGDDLALRIASTKLRWVVSVLSPSGVPITGLTDGSDFARLRISEAGDYTVIVSSSDGSEADYTLKLVDLNK